MAEPSTPGELADRRLAPRRDVLAARSGFRDIPGHRLAVRRRDLGCPGRLGTRPPRSLTNSGEGDHVIADGALGPIDRIRADEPYYSMKHRQRGMNVQVVTRPDGTPLWFSRATPGRIHDLTAARAHGIVQACLTRQVLVLADRAYQATGAVVSAPRTTVTANSPSTTSSSTATTPGFERLANAPSPN